MHIVTSLIVFFFYFPKPRCISFRRLRLPFLQRGREGHLRLGSVFCLSLFYHFLDAADFILQRFLCPGGVKLLPSCEERCFHTFGPADLPLHVWFVGSVDLERELTRGRAACYLLLLLSHFFRLWRRGRLVFLG